jgi:hypothetical protein
MPEHRTRFPEKRLLKPGEFMYARHPELFSDTPPLLVPVLEKSRLEYYLETLTSRKQEQVFEEFCRRLAELEICPNLKPQTGPTGGGDSKVDTSTYPVAPALVERCYWGTPKPPSDEAWAFAFSCKKRWKEKVAIDVEKIVKLDRKFTKVFFISNQFIRDKVRAQVESVLSKKHGFELHILDRSWIVKTVIEHKREDVAIETLGLRVAETEKPQLGVRDASRQRKFDALLKKVGQPELYYGNDYALAQDYLTAAELARGLGKPRHEVDGLFVRARSLAQKFGYEGQISRCGYHHAWTSFWWFDDPVSLERIYSEIEGCLPNTFNAEDCELFSNLWLLLYGAVKRGAISLEKARLDERLSHIRIKLERLAAEKERPNNALHAETLLYFLDLVEGIENASKVEQAFDGLRKCLRQSVGLGTYPVVQFINRFSEMGSFLGHLPGYNSLFSEMRRIARDRLGETSEGELLYRHGMQLIERGKLQDVLRYLGQAQVKLAKRETLQNSIRAALGCCHAYMGMDLYWAARMEALTAAHNALRTIEAAYEFPVEGVLASICMGWLELRLGRIAPFIAWYQLSWLLLGHLRSIQYGDVERLEEDLRIQEGVLGCFFLNLDSEDVKELADLQQNLAGLNLPMARWALLYALGEIDTLVKEVPDELASNRKKLDEFFSKWKAQPASEQLPEDLTREIRPYQKFETTIMNVSYHVTARNDFGSIAFAENLLGIIEAALALAKWENLAFIVDEVKVVVDVDASGDNPPPLDLEMPDPKGYYLIWKPDMLEWLKKTDRKQVHDYLMKFLLRLLLGITIDPKDDLTHELERWYEEGTFNRALGMSPTSIALMDLIGKERYELSYWCKPATPPQV